MTEITQINQGEGRNKIIVESAATRKLRMGGDAQVPERVSDPVAQRGEKARHPLRTRATTDARPTRHLTEDLDTFDGIPLVTDSREDVSFAVDRPDGTDSDSPTDSDTPRQSWFHRTFYDTAKRSRATNAAVGSVAAGASLIGFGITPALPHAPEPPHQPDIAIDSSLHQQEVDMSTDLKAIFSQHLTGPTIIRPGEDPDTIIRQRISRLLPEQYFSDDTPSKEAAIQFVSQITSKLQNDQEGNDRMYQVLHKEDLEVVLKLFMNPYTFSTPYNKQIDLFRHGIPPNPTEEQKTQMDQAVVGMIDMLKLLRTAVPGANAGSLLPSQYFVAKESGLLFVQTETDMLMLPMPSNIIRPEQPLKV